MKTKITQITLCILAVLFITNSANSQSAQRTFKYLSYIFPADSISGFDEKTANSTAMNGGFFGSEYHVFMYNSKRAYINQKYGIIGMGNPGNTSNFRPAPTNSVNNAPCVNEGFESTPTTVATTTAGATIVLAGWSLTEGQNTGTNGSCTMAGCCPQPTSNNCYCRATPWTAPAPLGVIPNSPLGGTRVLQMNDNITNQGEVCRISQTFPVTSSNCLFQFAYMAAMDGSGHLCCDQPFFRVDLMDCFNNVLACPQVSITPPGPSCATVAPTGWTTSGNISYTPSWIVKAIDLRPYLGSCITIKITMGDCDGWAHYGYGFVDCACLPMTVTVNNIPFLAGSTTAAVAACGVSTATMVAPPGLGPYSWTGPAGSGITANTNQTITTTMAGNYTLTMNPVGICSPITLTVNLQFGTNPLAGFTVSNSCTTYTITNTGTASPAVQSYSFVGAGAPSSFTTTSPTSVVSFPPSTTYTIYQTVTNASNCFTTFSMVITTPPGPSPAFTASPSFTQCFTGNAFTFNATTAAGSHTYNFSPSAGAPPSGFTNNYGPVSFTAPGTYTIIHTVNNAGCISTTQSVAVINSVPSATATGSVPACAGGQATLTASGGPGSVTWSGPGGFSAAGTPAVINNFQTANQGVYTLTINNGGCITTRTVNLNLGTVPSVTVTNTGPYCVGQTIQLNATTSAGGISFSYWYGPNSWYNFSTTLTPTLTNAQTTSSGVYYFYVYFSGGCYAQGQTTVSVVSTPTVSANNTGPYCAGATIQLNCPTAAGSYSWTGPSAFASSIQNPTRPTATPAMGGNYTVMIGSGSCTAAAVTNVVVNALPTPTAGSNSPVCLGTNINLTSGAVGAVSYTWSGPGGYTSTLQNPTIVGSTAAMAGIYTVTVTGAGGCKGTATVNVTINTPTTTAANAGPFCVGATISLSTPAATSYTWTGPAAFTSNAQNPTIALATAAMGGVYTVTSTTGGCKATATTTVVINPLPTPVAANTGPYCPGNTIQLNVGPFSSYSWTGPSTFTSLAQNPTIASALTTMSGNYVVTVKDVNGCINSATTNVVVNPNPTPVIGSNSPVCVGNTINLTSGGGTGYSWNGPAAFTSAVQNPNIAGATVVNAGVYTVTVTALGCTATATTNVVISTPTTSAANTGPYCAGATIQLNGGAATSYTWNGPGGYTANTQNPTRPGSTPAMSGTYTIMVSIGTCSATATTSVTVNALPTPTAGNTGPYCPGNTIQLNGSAATSYTWSGPVAFNSNLQNPTQGSATTAMGGVYTLTVTDVNGCKNSVTTNVVVNPNPTPIIGSNSPVCLNSNLNLTSGGGTGYSWSGPSAFTSALQNPTVAGATAVNSGVYTVTVTSLGCTATATTNVVVTTPTTSAGNTGPYCAGATIQLSAPAATSYTWSGPGGFTSNVQNATRPGATVAMSGNYVVLVSIGTCTATATTSVTVNALPTPTAGNTGPYCPGNTIQLNGSAATSYTWSGPVAFNSNLQNPTQGSATTAMGGVYTLTVTDVNGCKNSVTTNVVVNPNPTPIIGSNSPVCVNTNINLTSGGGTGYSWSGPSGFTSALQNPTVAGATLGNAGVYNLTVTALGCSSTTLINVSVLTPTTTAANTSPYCAGTTIQLSTPAATSYTWSGPGGFASSLQNPTRPASTVAMSGVYTVIVSIGTCTANATTSVTVNALPNPVANSNSPVCVGQAINFTGTAATSYTWTGPSFTSNAQNPSIPSATTSNAGVYTFSVTDVNGCKNGITTNVVVNTLPVIAVNNPTACVNTGINLTSNGGTSYSWSGPGGFTSAAQNPNIASATSLMTGAYTVTVTNAAGCKNTAVANVSVVALPVPNALTAGPVCLGATLGFSANGGTSYSWSGPGGFTSNQQNPTLPNSTMGMNGPYTVIVTANTCTASATINGTVNALPVANIVSNSPVCIGQAITMTGNGGANYTWTGPGGFTSNSQNTGIPVSAMSSAGTYSLTVVDANGCIGSTNAVVVVNPLPTPVAVGGSACQNGNVTLGATGGVVYSWSGPAGFTSNLQNPTIAGLTVANAGQYTVTVTNGNGCTNVATANMVVNAAPIANIQTNSPICLNNVLSLSGSGGVSYSWNGPGGFFSTAQTPTILATSVAFSGNYNVTVTDANGCSSSASTGATINPIPNAMISAVNNKGCAPLCMTFTASSSSALQGYSWNLGNGSTNNSAVAQTCYATTGVYSISATMTDMNGCSNGATYTVQVLQQPVADFNYSPIRPIEGVDVVEFTDASYNSGVVSWSWFFMANGQYTSSMQNPTFIYDNAGNYAIALVVKNAAGCTDTVVKSIEVGEDFGVFVPNAFTPNGDGLNDVFYAKGYGVKKFEMTVYDRWGEKIFHSTDMNSSWDGSYLLRGQTMVEEGAYTWQIKLTNVFGKSKELTGHVTLIK